MGKAKYTRDKQGYFSTNVFDGTYDEYGRKHYKRIRSRKSSTDLEKMVQEFGALVKTGKVSRKTDTTVEQYAAAWLKTKAIYTNNTQRQYADIIRYYITPMIGNVRLCELSKIHFQQLIAQNAQHPRTCQLIRRTVLQIAESAVDDHLLSETVLRPLRGVQLPKYARKERRVLTDAEKAQVTNRSKIGEEEPAYLTVIDRYMSEVFGKQYAEGEHCVPIHNIVAVDKHDAADILVWGDYWVFNYNQVGDTLKCVSGGSHPGLMHLQQTDKGFEVKAFDQVGDGSSYLPTAKKIFGDKFDAFQAINSDEKKREQLRADVLTNYVKAHNLTATMYQDYGWPAHKLGD